MEPEPVERALAPLISGVDGEALGWAEGSARRAGPPSAAEAVAWLEGAARAALVAAGLEAELASLTLELHGELRPGRVRAEVVALGAGRVEVEVEWRDGAIRVASLSALYRR